MIELGDGVEREQLTRTSELLLRELEPDAQDVKLGHLATLVLRGAARLAHKTALYATLVGLVNARKPAFGREVVAGATRSLQRDVDFFSLERLDDGDTPDTDVFRRDGDVQAVATRVRLTVRLLAELCSARVCKAEDVLAMLDSLQGLCTPDDWDGDDETHASLRARETPRPGRTSSRPSCWTRCCTAARSWPEPRRTCSTACSAAAESTSRTARRRATCAGRTLARRRGVHAACSWICYGVLRATTSCRRSARRATRCHRCGRR